mgnify:CR=1 FL=1
MPRASSTRLRAPLGGPAPFLPATPGAQPPCQPLRLIRERLYLGLLSRQDNPQDRRSHHLLPTAAGVAAVVRFAQAEADVARLLFGHLNAAELGGLTTQLGTLRERLDQLLPEPDAS